MYKPSSSHQKFLDILTEKDRPKKTANLMDEYLGDQREYQKAVDDGFQGTYEEFLRFKSMRENAAQGGVIGKDGMFKGQDMGTRKGFATISKKPLSKEKFVELYEKFLNTDQVNKSDRVFAETLNEKGYRTQSNTLFDDSGVFARRTRYKIKGVVKGSEAAPDILKRIQNVNEYLSDLIFKLNPENKYYSLDEIQTMVRKKFKFSESVSLDKRSYPIFDQLLDRDQKVEQLLKKMLISDEPLNTSFLRYISKEVGGARRKTRTGPLVENELDFKTLKKSLNKSPTYKIIKDQGADLLKDRFNKNEELFKLSFSDQLEEALDLAKGQPVFTGMDKEKYYSSSSKHKVMEFAKRSWNTSKGKGPIKFFNSKGNEITWQRGLKLPYRKVSFTYEGKKYSMKELDNIDFVKKNFPEVYEKQTAVNRLRAVEVDNPYGKGKIPLLDLLKENSRKIYGWAPRRNTFDVLHGIDGVGSKPFTDLSFNSRDVNQMQLGVSNTFKANRISKKDFDKINLTMNEYTGGGNPAKIQERQLSLAKDFLSGEVKSYDEERDRIIKSNKASRAFKNYAAAIGLKLNDDQKTIIKKINNAPIPNKAKALLLPIVVGATAITGADLMTGSVEAAEPGQMPQGSPKQLSEDQQGFTTGEKLAGAGAAGGAYAARKPILNTLGKIAKPILKVLGAPSLAAGLSIKELAKGEDANLGVAGAELLAPELAKQAGVRGLLANPFQLAEKAAKFGKIGRGVASLARIPSLMTPVGLTLMGVEGVRMAKREQDRINEMRREEPEKYKEYIDELESYGDFSA